MSWEHHATLIITSVMKGIFSNQELPIIIHFGLAPVIAGRMNNISGTVAKSLKNTNDPIELYVTGSMNAKIPGDIRDDHIWFLRKKNDHEGGRNKDSTEELGLWDPQDIQPLEFKPYYLAFISGDTGNILKKFADAKTQLGMRSQAYLDHLEIERISKMPHISEYFDQLLHYYLSADEKNIWSHRVQYEAKRQIEACGIVGSERLVSIFQDPKHKRLQLDILSIWERTGYKDAIPILIQLLEKDDLFWANQKMQQKKWWLDAPDPSTGRERGYSHERIQFVTGALSNFVDPRTEKVLNTTRALWEFIEPDGVIVSNCAAALEKLEHLAKQRSKSP